MLSDKQIADVRSISRTLVRELGFMNRNIAGTDLSPSAVHAIVEIGMAGSLSALELRSLLILEKSSISRLIQSLLRKGLVEEMNSTTDGRVKLVKLTRRGEQTLDQINAYAESRISSSLNHLGASEVQTLLIGLALYSRALTQDRTSADQ